MILINSSFEDLRNVVIKEDKRVILFGAGVIGRTTLMYKLDELNLMEKVSCYVDNDSQKWGHVYEFNTYKLEVKSSEYLNELYGDQYIIIITMSQYYSVVKQLDKMNNLDNVICYIAPIMFINQYKNERALGVVRDSETPLIPKKIHYMWFGDKQLPKSLRKCIDSWKKFCPDYEIICWNESNYDVKKSIYMQQAFENKKWGFIPDYARLDILYNYGGIYMDTDVELVRSLDDLLYQQAFCCVEKWQVVNFGSCSGAVRGNKVIGELLDYRENVTFINEDATFNMSASGMYEMPPLYKSGYKINGKIQKLKGLNIYTYDFFNPYDYMTGQTQTTLNTYGVHHFNGGWIEEEILEQRKRTVEEYFEIINRMNNK